MPADPLTQALAADDLPTIESLLNPQLLNPTHGRPPITLARSRATAQRLLALGANLDAVSKWWSPGFYTRTVHADVAKFLVEQGAAVSLHAAAGLGLFDHLTNLLAADPSLVHAKGGDGCTPLHFARTIEIARLLLDHGALPDARDEDHDSTPAQWLIGDAPEIARYLLTRGAQPDIFLAAALGDRALAEQLIAADPSCPSHRIGRLPHFPPLGGEHRGGTIYQWTLAFNSYPHQIALAKGHPDLFNLLYDHSDTPTRLLVNCVLARRPEAEAIAAQHPALIASLPPEDLELPARYCWETNTNYEAVKLMLDVGFPVAHPEHSHGYSPLHNAAWSGSADLVDLLISRGAPVDLLDPQFHATPLGYAIHDCIVEKRHPEGDFGRVAKSLLDAGSPWDALEYPTGDARLDDAFRPRLSQRIDGAALLADEPALTKLLGSSPTPEQLAQALAGAAKGGYFDLCRSLLSRGAPVNAPLGQQQSTPLMYASRSKSQPTVALLLNQGANAQAKNANGSTALHMAVGYGADLQTIRLLLNSGADPSLENNYGYTPLRVAKDHNRPDVMELLQQAR